MRHARTLTATVLAATALTAVLLTAPGSVAGEGPAIPPQRPNPAPSAEANARAEAVEEVETSYTTADGVTHGSVYLAAPGVSAKELAAKLRAAGVRGVVEPGGVSAMAGNCGWGSAANLDGQCPVINWRRNGYTNPQIYYNDRSGASWPQGTALTQWNQSPNIHVERATGGCPNYSGTHCVDVVDGSYGATGWLGVTSYSYDSARYFIDGTVSIKYNNSYASNHRAVACHESGHAFGVGHNTSTNSCMYGVGPNSNVPNADDYALIVNRLYPR
ncbi:hypothetical protein DEJ50_13895 [Streptomyces venezuelae]|uniref:Peptidase M10 metallopeptidase domain-containing protein n=1 Tax=Streptomyces venezuelae TaxID=54571 RepID=A0A5P2D3Y8_STRVZ|nr:hypothetical protein [Streptomyces venezuelae]QES48748.1 hypothetical protein DEJ50_13895 [Streptomyces venezuelae]